MKGQKTFLTTHLILLALSLLTAFRVIPEPDIVGVSLGFYCLFVLPGMVLGRLIGGLEGGLLERLCRIFISGLLFLSSIVWLGLLPGVSYAGIAVGGAVLNVLLLVLYYCLPGGKGCRRNGFAARSPLSARRPCIGAGELVFAVLVFAVCFVFFFGNGEDGWNTDALDHISYVRRSLDSGELFPGDSFYRDGDGVGFDPRKGLWHPILALWAFQADTTPELLWSFVPSFICFFALAVFAWFALTLTSRPLYAAIAMIMLLLSYGGEGIGWFIKTGFSRNLSQVLFWGGTACMVRHYESGRRHFLFWASVYAAIGTAFHIVHALLVAAACLALILYVTVTRLPRSWRTRFWISVPVLALATVVPLAVRELVTHDRFNIIHTHRQGMLIFSRTLAMVDPVEILARFGPAFFFALLIMPLFFWAADGRERRGLVGTLFIVPVLVVLIPFTGSLLEMSFGYLHYRILYSAPLFCLLGLAIPGLFRLLMTGRAAAGSDAETYRPLLRGRSNEGGGKTGSAARLGKRILALILLCVFFLYPVRFSALTFGSAAKRILDQGGEASRRTDGLIEVLKHDIPEHSVIVSDPRTSYMVSAFTDHFVTVTLDQHCSPSDTLALRRLLETRDIFSPSVALSSSFDWLAETGADFLLVDGGMEGRSDFFGTVPSGNAPIAFNKFNNCNDLFEEVWSGDSYRLFRIERDALERGPITGCTEAGLGAVTCDSSQPADEGFFMTGVMPLEHIFMDRDSIAPGDTLSGYFCWAPRDTVAFGLPIEWVIRLDAEFPKGPFYRWWYGKQYRRFIERSNGIFYRFSRSERLASGFTNPDQWKAGERIKQAFAFPTSQWLERGRFDIRVKTRSLPYLPNRRISDYLLNEDTLQGELVGVLYLVGPTQSEWDTGDVDRAE